MLESDSLLSQRSNDDFQGVEAPENIRVGVEMCFLDGPIMNIMSPHELLV